MLRVSLAAAAAFIVASPLPARAFCGFYVGSADGSLVNEATMVVMLRDGTDTVLSMRNDYRGPPEDFAMVVPVPQVLGEEDVKVLPSAIFDTVERLAAPRLVEYWEQDPCPDPNGMLGSLMGESGGFGGLGLRGTGRGGGGAGRAPVVTVEAEFAVGEYDIVILSARDSAGLEDWLVANDYRIPSGAAELLRPYVENESKFFVAKVDVDRVSFEDGRAVLSPLRVHYQSESFSLPVRLGLLSAGEGKQDLIVHILANRQRYELANYENVTIPTNVEVAPGARERFAELYAALFDETLASHPNAVVTEYAWTASSCDPCPGPSLTARDIATLGGDLVHDGPIRIAGRGGTIGLGNLGTIGGFGTTSRGGSTASGRRARVRPGEATVSDGLPKEVVRRIVRRHINEVRYCYERELNRKPDLEGRVVLKMIIQPGGRVSGTSIESSTVDNGPVESCLAAAGRRWAFPQPQDGQVVTVSYPFVFSSQAGSTRTPRPSSGFGGGLGLFGGGGAGPFNGYVLTRLHYRYDADDLGEDLVFREADPIEGGREHSSGLHRGVGADPSPEGAHPAPTNNFQGRYIIRHEWEGPIECEEPRRGVWGGRPNPPPAEGEESGPLGAVLGSGSAAVAPPLAATDLAQAPRGDASVLDQLITARGGNAQAAEPSEAAEAAPEESAPEALPASEATPAVETEESGCGCRVAGGRPMGAPLAALALLAFGIAGRRRRVYRRRR